jgi:putative DNA primase/helicase
MSPYRTPEEEVHDLGVREVPPTDPGDDLHKGSADAPKGNGTGGRKRRHRPRNNAPIVTEDLAALEYAQRHAGELLYDHDAGQWLRWCGSHWQPERTRLAFHWARNLARELAENETAATRIVLSKVSFASGVERFAQADRTFAARSDIWDRDPWLLATPGDTVDLRTGLLRPANPADRITKITAVAPAASSDCPHWLVFLEETTGGDKKLIGFLQRWAGYCLTGSTREQAFCFVYGDGGNGKGTFINALTGAMGDYAKTAAMETFVTSYSDRHPTELAMLRGARLVTARETEEGRAWAESRIKQLTGGDPISARFMRQDFFEFMPTFKLMLIGNNKPILRNVDEAARRRINIVPFIRKPREVDKELDLKLKAEWPGILRWAIEGCLAWRAQGLAPPPAVTEATAAYFSDQDLFGQWLDERCDVDPGNSYKFETAADLFASWKVYATAAGDEPGSQRSFADKLQRRGIITHRTMHARTYRGIRLLATHDA